MPGARAGVGALFLLLLLSRGAPDALARGPLRASEDNTRGWQLMTPEERIAHQARLRAFVTLEACRDYQRAHQREMVARARARGLPPPPGTRDFCAHLAGAGG
jgi:hypothetical protein